MGTVRDRVPRVSNPGLAVFVSGVASMGLEILAGRIIAPQYGSSIYTWGAIIGVFLGALSLGYHRGGRRAASHASDRRLVWLLVATAGYVAVLIFAGDLLLLAASPLPLPSRYASLPSIVLLFGPPTYLLGFISPYAAELSAKEGIGEASGHVYMLGTVGSLVGVFGTTFVLIPSLSVERIALLFGLLLVGTSAWIAMPSPSRRSTISIGLAALLLLAAAGSGSLGYSVHGKVVYETQTPYQELQVVDAGDTRTLYLDGQRHSAMDRDDPTRHVFDYTRYFHMPFLYADDGTEDVDRVLFVGGGGFSGPKAFVDEYDATVDVVEIDPEVTDAAEEYFAVEESDQLNVHTMDGRQFLQETDHEYDVIVLDAYKKDKVPFHMTTEEFMQLASDRMTDDGILVANIISAPSGPASQFYRSEYKTMSQVFPQVDSYRTADVSAIQNVELVATKDDDRIDDATLRERNAERDLGIDLSDEIETRLEEPETDDVPVLQDGNAPVDSLLDPMVGQRYVIEESAPDGGGEGAGGDDGNETSPSIAADPTVSVRDPGAPIAVPPRGSAG